jgi:hypothetical protein
MVLSLVLPALVVLFIMSRAYTAVDEDFVVAWAPAHALTLTPRNRPMVRWYLHTARVLRAWGVVAGLILPWLVDAAFGLNALGQAQPLFAFFGYLVGALYAELALVRRTNGTRRVAALAPRDLDDYLPRRLLVGQRALAGAVVAVCALLFVVPADETIGNSPAPVSVAVIAAVLGLALPRVERWLLQRPQPFTDVDLIAADDAIRSQSLHSVAGSGLAILLMLLGGGLFNLATSDVQLLRWTMWAPGLACFVGSIYVCLYYGHRAWRVRRALPRAAAA